MGRRGGPRVGALQALGPHLRADSRVDGMLAALESNNVVSEEMSGQLRRARMRRLGCSHRSTL